MDLRTAVVLNALLVLLYFCHLASQVLALGTVLGFAAVLNRARALRTLNLAVILTVAHLALLTERFAALNRDLDEFTSGRPYVERNDLLLPLSFDDRGFADSRISTFSHAADFHALDGGTIGLDNYEARSGYFPLVFAPGMSPFATIGTIEEHPGETRPDRYPRAIDVILIWREDRVHPVFAWIREHHEVVHRQGGLTLFGRRVAAASR